MATVEERMQILKMIEEGKISAAEGAKLLRALDQEKEESPSEPLKGASAARWFRVRITDTSSGKNKVNVNIPIGLVNVGMKMGAKFTPEIDGVDFESLWKAVNSGKQGKVIDLYDDDEGERVEIFVE